MGRKRQPLTPVRQYLTTLRHDESNKVLSAKKNFLTNKEPKPKVENHWIRLQLTVDHTRRFVEAK